MLNQLAEADTNKLDDSNSIDELTSSISSIDDTLLRLEDNAITEKDASLDYETYFERIQNEFITEQFDTKHRLPNHSFVIDEQRYEFNEGHYYMKVS